MNGERRKSAYLTFVTESEPETLRTAAIWEWLKRKSAYFTFVMEVSC